MCEGNKFSLWALCLLACALSGLACDHSPGTSSSQGIQPLLGLSYTSPAVYSQNTPIVENLPQLQQGVATSFSISPELPDGLVFDTQTGVLRGTPVATSILSRYTVTASNGISIVTAPIDLLVARAQKFCVTDPENNRAFLIDTANPGIENTIDLSGARKKGWDTKPHAVAFGLDRYFAIVNQPEDQDQSGDVTMVDIDNPYPSTLPAGKQPMAVAYGSRYFAVLNKGSGNLTWIDATPDSFHSDFIGNDLSVVAYGGGRFAVVQQGTPAAMYRFAPGAKTYSIPITDLNFANQNGVYVDIAFGDDKFLLVNQTTQTGVLVSAQDGTVLRQFPLGAKPTAVAYGNGVFAVTNAFSNTVSLLDPRTFVVKTVPVGLSPQSIAYGNGYFVVCHFAYNDVSVLDSFHDEPLATIAVDYSPSLVVFGNNRFLIRHRYSEAVLLLDATQGLPTLQAPNIPLAFSPFSSAAYSSSDTTSMVCVAGELTTPVFADRVNLIDTNYDNVVKSFDFPLSASSKGKPKGVAFGRGLFAVTNNERNQVYMINRATQQVDATVDLPAQINPPHLSAIIYTGLYNNDCFVALDQSNDRAFVVEASNDVIALLVLPQPVAIACGDYKCAVAHKNSTGVTFITLGNPPNADATTDIGFPSVAVAFGNSRFAVVSPRPNMDTGLVSFLASASHHVMQQVEVGERPVAIAYGNNKFAIANQGDDSVTIIDAETGEVQAQIGSGLEPSNVIYAGNRFVVINQGESTVTLIDATTNEYLVGLVLPGGTVKSVCFSNNRFIATMRESNGVAIMDAIYNQPITTLTYSLQLPEAIAASD